MPNLPVAEGTEVTSNTAVYPPSTHREPYLQCGTRARHPPYVVWRVVLLHDVCSYVCVHVGDRSLLLWVVRHVLCIRTRLLSDLIDMRLDLHYYSARPRLGNHEPVRSLTLLCLLLRSDYKHSCHQVRPALILCNYYLSDLIPLLTLRLGLLCGYTHLPHTPLVCTPFSPCMHPTLYPLVYPLIAFRVHCPLQVIQCSHARRCLMCHSA